MTGAQVQLDRLVLQDLQGIPPFPEHTGPIILSASLDLPAPQAHLEVPAAPLG